MGTLCVAAGCLLVLTGCTADVAVVGAQASVAGDRIRLLLDSCNADLDIRWKVAEPRSA